MSDNRECQKCGDYYTLRQECEPTAYCDLCAQTMLQDAENRIAQLTKERNSLKAESIQLGVELDVSRQACKIYESARTQLAKERDELRDLVDKVNSVGYGTAFTRQIERIQNERDSLRTRAETAEAKCAEMQVRLDQCGNAIAVPRAHEMLESANPECACAACNLHRRYQGQKKVLAEALEKISSD